MKNFLDPDDNIELDMGIFDEEDEDVIVEEEKKKEPGTKPGPGDLTVDVDGDTVDPVTGEVLIEALVENKGPEVDKVVENMEKLGLTTDWEGKPEKAPESPLEDLAEMQDPSCDMNGEQGTEGDVGAPAEKPKDTVKGNSIQKAISLLDYHHVKDLEPDVQFSDCDFGVFETEIAEAQEIIDRYYNEGFEQNLGRAEWDLGKLSAIMVRLGRAVGFFQGGGEQIEKFRRATEAGVYVELKELKVEHELAVSDKDADKTSRMLAAKYTKKHVKNELLAKMITNFWFSARKFIDVLEGIIVRNRSGAKTEVHAEAAARRPDPDDRPVAPEVEVFKERDMPKPPEMVEKNLEGDALDF